MIATMVVALSLGVNALGALDRRRQRTAWSAPLLLGLLSALGALTGAWLSLGTGLWQHRCSGAVSFAVLSFAGGRMLLEAVRPPEEPQPHCERWRVRFAVLDTLLAGLTLPLLSVNLGLAAALTGGAALLLSALGIRLPDQWRLRLYPWLCAAGGLALTSIGMQLLLRTLGAAQK